jgi:purine-cytosine permease-like protein
MWDISSPDQMVVLCMVQPVTASRGTPERRAPLDVSYTDDPRVVKEAATEDYSTHVMPRSWRSGRLSLAMAWGSMVSAMFWVYMGALTAAAAGTVNAVIGLVLTCFVYGGMNFVLTKYAARTGLTVALISRRLFGYVGSILAPLIFAATTIYYSVFEGSIVAHALESYFGGGDIRLWYALVVLYSIPLIAGGVRTWMDRLNGALLPFYIVGMIALVVWASFENGASLSVPNPGLELAAPGWVWTFTVYMGVYILMMYTVDFARFSKPEDAEFHAKVTFGPPFYLLTYLGNGLIGMFLAATVPGVLGDVGITETGIVSGIIGTMGVLGLLLIFISQTRINTANLYLASTNLEAFGSRVLKVQLPRFTWAIVCGALVYLIMLTDVLSYILRALNWQGVFVVAWVAIALVHIAVTRKDTGTPEFRPGRLKAATPAVAVWIVASVIGIYLVEGGGTVGATWSAPVTFVLAAVGYLAVAKYDVVLRRGDDPRDEVDDVWAARIKCHVCEKSYTALEMDRDPSHEERAAICSGCASASPHLHRAAVAEAKAASTH